MSIRLESHLVYCTISTVCSRHASRAGLNRMKVVVEVQFLPPPSAKNMFLVMTDFIGKK
jgi:hypothetical protein